MPTIEIAGSQFQSSRCISAIAMTDKTREKFGIRFWLGWILGFAGLLVLAALFWTGLLFLLFHEIKGKALSLTWSAAVFGSWFLLVIPFMRQKERIWKRLNADQEKAVDAWLFAMGSFIGFFILSSLGWSLKYKPEILNQPELFPAAWLKSVLATWLVLLLPCLLFLYRRAEAIFKSAEARQNDAGPLFKTLMIEKSKRVLPKALSEKLEAAPFTVGKGHIVSARLQNGRTVSGLFVLNRREILGIYGQSVFDFEVGDIQDLEVADPEKLPPYEESKWLRLDGRA